MIGPRNSSCWLYPVRKPHSVFVVPPAKIFVRRLPETLRLSSSCSGPINSYVRYFKDQGYDALYRHPGYSWFYNRSNVNEYLGFDECVFNESGFGDLISIEDALFKSDTVLVDYRLGESP